MSDKQTIKIFIASAGELQEERKECDSLINDLNDIHTHLQVSRFKWENSLVQGNFPGKETIQDGINPDLINSDIIVFIFYSRLGVNTRKEFKLAMQYNKQILMLIKNNFTSRIREELKQYDELLSFLEDLNNTVIQLFYNTLSEFKEKLSHNLHLYLSKNHAQQIAIATDSKFSESITTLIQLLAAKEEEIKQLKEYNITLPPFSNDDQLDSLIKEKESLQQELLQSKEIQEQQAKDKAALEQQLSQYTASDELKTRALQEVERGNYTEAEEYLKESAKTSIAKTAATFYELAKIKKLQLQYKEAFEYFELAVKINSENSLYLNEAGRMANILGFYNKAIDYSEKAIQIDKKNHEDEHIDIATKYENLALGYYENGKYNKAIDYLKKGFSIYKKIHGEDNPYISTWYNNIGLAYNSKREYNKAIQYFKKALLIGRKYYGEDHLEIAIMYNNIGLAYSNIREYERAIQYHEKALMIDKKNYREDHPNIAIKYNNLGLDYSSIEEYKKAIEYYERALVIDRKYFGEEHPTIATRYNNLGSAYNSKGEHYKAIDYYNRSLSILQKFFPSNHPNIQTVQRNLQLAQQALNNQ